MKILLVDDDEAMRRLMTQVLEKRGHQVFSSETPYGVSALILRHLPELVLLDVRMPGLSGPQLSLLINELPVNPRPKIVFWSALEAPQLQAIAHEAGDVPYISKVDSPIKIADAIETHRRR